MIEGLYTDISYVYERINCVASELKSWVEVMTNDVMMSNVL